MAFLGLMSIKTIYAFMEKQDNITPDKRWYPYNMVFFHFSMKTYVVGICTHLMRLIKALQMSTHNIGFGGEIRKISVLFGSKRCLIWRYGHYVSGYLSYLQLCQKLPLSKKYILINTLKLLYSMVCYNAVLDKT